MNPKTIIQKMMRKDVKPQYQSPWNEWLTNMPVWLIGTLTVLNVIPGLELGAKGFLYPREVNFLKGDSQW